MVFASAFTPLADEDAAGLVPVAISPQLLEANQHLLALRQQRQADATTSSDKNLPVGKHCRIPRETRRQNGDMPVVSIYGKATVRKPELSFHGENRLDVGTSLSAYTTTAVATHQSIVGKILANLPPHLGWGSKRLSDIGRTVNDCPNDQCQPITAVLPLTEEKPFPASTHPLRQAQGKSLLTTHSFTLCWGLAYAVLREEVAPVARIWLLLRHLDENGQGWISIKAARQALTEKASPLRVCGWRQLRNLLTEGQGVFWERDKERIWLRSTARVAFALGVEQMGRAVSLPLGVLNGRLADFKAHLYATFHTCRQKQGREAMPIARATLANLSGIQPSSQRTYEKTSGIRKAPNFAVGVREGNREMVEEMTWQKGTATFSFRDSKGKQGPKQTVYLAWQIPNSYLSAQTSKGKQKRHNRQLADLRQKRGVGNDQKKMKRRYFPDGAQAVKSYTRNGEQEAYWQGRTGDGIWCVFVSQTRK